MVKKTPNFRCKAHEATFQNIYKSYTNEEYSEEVDNSGGRASGKSHASLDNLVFWLPEVEYDEALVLCYSSRHKIATSELVQEKLYSHGYADNYRLELKVNGDYSYHFGNNNILTVMSAESKQLIQMVERLKNIQFSNTKFKKHVLKFLVLEEFTAVLNVFGNLDKLTNALSSFNRHKVDRPVTIYNYNPPENHKHLVYTWRDTKKSILGVKTTIFDLPERFKSPHDVKQALELKESNPKQFNHIYMGQPIGSEGLAFEFDESIWTHSEHEYYHFYVQTDEGTVNATTFTLFGLTYDGDLHLLDNYYHSSKFDGQRKSPSTYANLFDKWLKSFEVEIASICTDGLAFSEELRKIGYKSKSIGKLKNRALSYNLLNKLICENSFKIVNSKQNILAYEQLSHAELEYNNQSMPQVSKMGERGEKNIKHTHIVDTILYMCLRLQKQILRGRKI